MSEREPELGLGVVASIDRTRISIKFPATGEQRLYAVGTPVLKRVLFRVGETIATGDGASLVVESVDEEGGLLVYVGKGRRVREDALSDVTSVALPQERLMAGQVDEGEVFDLRYRTLQAQWKFRQLDVRGFLGGRLELIPHQFYILQEVASRQIPRVLLADEVGLGKTIEACLIIQRLLAVGQARRVLILVPESLTHQWFVELLRRFNLWFSIFDEGRCTASERSDPAGNPFLAAQLALCGVDFLAQSEVRREQAIAAGWDMVVVDEAHHLQWAPENPSAEYALVERLARGAPGLLLLTATPTQLGLAGHFARLRLLDPHRYDNFERFVRETEAFGSVAEVADKLHEQKPLKPKDQTLLKKIFTKTPEVLAAHLEALEAGKPGAREALLRTLLDQHGTGRVVFRNTRASMPGFPKRKLCPEPVTTEVASLVARSGRELQAEETGTADTLRYSYREDPRIDWLADFLRSQKSAKVLLICRTQRKVLAIEAALQERMTARLALFHEGLPLVLRDRNAAYFAEPEGAQLLLCSEIGSEGRNFQFAHHLVLFDLPLNPGLLEQRIGRLDRIGQTQTIRIHVPYLAGSAEEAVLEWYHRGLDSIETPLHGGEEYQAAFKARLLELAVRFGDGAGTREELDGFIAETVEFRKALAQKLKKGRDRLLELNSFDRAAAARVIERIRAVDADPFLRSHLVELLDHFGVRIKEHEEGDVFLDPSHAYIEGFPSIPPDGMLATFQRARAIAREDIRFVSIDHPLVRDAADLLINSPAGTASFGRMETGTPGLLLEAIFVLETVADSRWHVDAFLAPMPVRVLVDLTGENLTEEIDAGTLANDVEDADIHRFLERPGFTAAVLKVMVEGATEIAEKQSEAAKAAARSEATGRLGAEIRRLVELQKVNDHVRPEEITLAQARLERVLEAIGQARLRLDSLRLVLQAGGEPLD